MKNPYNSGQLRKVSLLPPSSEDGAELFAFWTRDPSSILEYAGTLGERGYGFYVMTTVTGYPQVLEPNVPPADGVIETMSLLAQKISAERVIWRYDPVFLSDITDFGFHRRNFADLAGRLKGVVRKVIVSVYDEYPAAEKRLAALEQRGVLARIAHYEQARPGPFGGRALAPSVRELLAELACIARREGMEIQSCAEDIAGCSGIRAGACIDGEYISKTFGLNVPGKDRGQRRPFCLCSRSVDIGAYGACPAGCVYCFAVH